MRLSWTRRNLLLRLYQWPTAKSRIRAKIVRAGITCNALGDDEDRNADQYGTVLAIPNAIERIPTGMDIRRDAPPRKR